MRITSGNFLHHLFWLIGILICSIIIASFIPSMIKTLIPLLYPTNAMVDIHVQDGYEVLGWVCLILPVFVFLTFVVFFIREWRHRFSRNFSSFVTLVSGFCLLVFFALLSYTLMYHRPTFSFGGWTSYPPLGVVPEEVPATMTPAADMIFNSGPIVIILLQIMVTLCLLFVAYRFGKYRIQASSSPNI